MPKTFSICVEHRVAREIADDDQQRVRGRIILRVELLELLALVGGDLFFGGRNHGVGMLAENHAAEALVCEKRGRGAFDAQAFDFAAALALEFIVGKRGVAREVGHEFEDSFGKLGEAGEGNRAGISAGLRAEIGAHAAKIFFDLAAGTRRGAGAHDRGSDFRKARRAMRDAGIAAAEEKLRGNFREGAQFGENDLHAVRESVHARVWARRRDVPGRALERRSFGCW